MRRCNILFIAFLITVFFRNSGISNDTISPPIPVIVTLPVLKDLVEKVGKNRVTVRTLITGLESEHTYTPKPSDVVAVEKAKLFVKVGLGLEIWVDALIKNADNPGLVVVNTSDRVPLLMNRDSSSRGNPHIWLDPDNAKIMAGHIARGLGQIDSNHSLEYRQNEAALAKDLDRLTKEMLQKVAILPSSSRKIITHHPAWPYFAKRFGFIVVDEIQPQVGGELSAKRLGALVQLMRREKVRVIVSEPQLNPKIAQTLAEETGARTVVLSPLPGVLSKTADYFDFTRTNVETLVTALQ